MPAFLLSGGVTLVVTVPACLQYATWAHRVRHFVLSAKAIYLKARAADRDENLGLAMF